MSEAEDVRVLNFQRTIKLRHELDLPVTLRVQILKEMLDTAQKSRKHCR